MALMEEAVWRGKIYSGVGTGTSLASRSAVT